MHVHFVVSCFAISIAAIPTGMRMYDREITAAEATTLVFGEKKKLADLRAKPPKPPKNFNWDQEVIIEGPNGEILGTGRPVRPPGSAPPAPPPQQPSPPPPPPQQEWVPDPSYQPEDPDTWENDVPPSQQAIQAVEDAQNGVYNPLHAQQQNHEGAGAYADYDFHGHQDSGHPGSYVDYDYQGHTNSGHPGSYVDYDYEGHPQAHHHGYPAGRPQDWSTQMEPFTRSPGGYFWESGASPVYQRQGSQQGQGILSTVMSGGAQLLRTGAQMVSGAVQQYQHSQNPRPMYPHPQYQGSGYHEHAGPGQTVQPAGPRYADWVYDNLPGEGPPGRIVGPDEYH
ncbi:uncharacterized protein PpBr36_10386 [Pyricularia pennisetigena]|uniref:uncharacterized protein n=1 Tax=Pyricularia pennisetigena TaxID=1578925 RepID=UPI0011512002|nr:uncharacterized protein PpBr36_10386 [Pyricularia pennisetigena]TLS21351.1 hypothetical protein PpBr36_10386 [Pyricularia pennisetigena]